MELRRELKALVMFSLFFLFLYISPAEQRILQGVKEGVLLLKWYVKEHVLYCLIPAFFLAGAIGTFVSKDSILRYLGKDAPKMLAFLVASVSGTVLAVCSCTVLPLFAGLYLQGAGLGPATTFLYSGPAINVLAIILTTRILGPELGIARALGSISMGLLLGILMHFLFRESEKRRIASLQVQSKERGLTLTESLTFLGTLVAILITVTSQVPVKWLLLYGLFLLLLLEFVFIFKKPKGPLLISALVVTLLSLLSPYREIPYLAGVIMVSYLANSEKGLLREWFDNSYILARQIFPLLFIGVFFSGFFLGGYEGEGYIPKSYIETLFGGTGFLTHLFSATLTALMYFATLTEIPIIQGLLSQGVEAGPALSMLLAGPAISLPSILVLKAVLGPKKTLVYAVLVIILSSIYGYLYQLIIN